MMLRDWDTKLQVPVDKDLFNEKCLIGNCMMIWAVCYFGVVGSK